MELTDLQKQLIYVATELYCLNEKTKSPLYNLEDSVKTAQELINKCLELQWETIELGENVAKHFSNNGEFTIEQKSSNVFIVISTDNRMIPNREIFDSLDDAKRFANIRKTK